MIGIVASRLKETLRPPRPGHRARRGRHRQGLGPLDQRGRPWRRGPRREGQRPARRRRRPCHGGRAHRRAGRARAAARLSPRAARRRRSPRARDGRSLLLDAWLAPGGVAASLCDALDAGGPYGAGWPAPRVAAGPARLLKVSVVGNGHVRAIAAGDDGKSFKLIAFRAADTPLGQALLVRRPRPALLARRDDQARRMEWRQCGRDAPRGRRARLTAPCLTAAPFA